jgi:EXLDI family protein
MSEHKNIGYKIRRDGERALAFSGRIIGSADDKDHNSTRWTNVTIYRTASGRVVVEVEDRTQWQGESDHVRADSFGTATGAISYLRHADGDYYDADLSPAAQEAIEDASKNDEEFASAFTENI